MNFLELAKRVRQEFGYSGAGPVSVEGQSGVMAKVVDWTRDAWKEVQLTRAHWRFDWASFTTTLTDGQAAYDIEQGWALGMRSLASDGVYVYRTADGPKARTWPTELDWASFRLLSQPGVSGMPTYFSLSPDRKMHFYPAPMAGLTVVVEYYKRPQVLTANTDVPRMPAEYHMAIVWRAVMLACAHDENPGLYQSAQLSYRSLLRQMEITELPQLAGVETLA